MPVTPLFQTKYQRHSSSLFRFFFLLSVGCNIFLLAFFLFQWKEGLLWITIDPLPQTHRNQPISKDIESYLLSFLKRSDATLIEELNNTKLIANGYRAQELALALLRERGFQVEDPLRAVGAWPQLTTVYRYANKKKKIELFSMLSPQDISVVKQFIEESMLPLTAKTLIGRINPTHPSCVKQALFRTDEWYLFQQAFPYINKKFLLDVAKQLGPSVFQTIVTWKQNLTNPQEFGPKLLLLFAQHPSPLFAEILAARYRELLCYKSSDHILALLFRYLPEDSVYGKELSITLLDTQRKPHVWKMARTFLANTKKTAVPQTLQSLSNKLSPSVPSILPMKQKQRSQSYIVKKGDTLWSIAQRFQVNVRQLQALNHLHTDHLVCGQELKIPL